MNIKTARAPRKLSDRTRRLFSEADDLRFQHLGWLQVADKVPLKVACFAGEDGKIALVLIGNASGEFDILAVDLFSVLTAQRWLTTTTFEFVLPQPARGIFKNSYPGTGLGGLLRRHQTHLGELDGESVRRFDSLKNFKDAVREFVEYERQAS